MGQPTATGVALPLATLGARRIGCRMLAQGRSSGWLLLLVGSLVLLGSARAEAYLDPGTGSFLLQLAAGAAFAAIFVLKAFWGRVKTFLRGGRTGAQEADD